MIKQNDYTENADTKCWIWQGASAGGGGYGRVAGEGYAHRVAYAQFKGPIGDLCVLHKCDNRLCVNPEHLFLGTKADNSKDKLAKRRGGTEANRKLNSEQVLYARSSGKSAATLSRELHISHPAMMNLLKGLTYRDI